MRRDLAEAMMRSALALGPEMNQLSALSEQLEGEERRRIRMRIGDMMGGSAGIVLSISREYPDLDPDR